MVSLTLRMALLVPAAFFISLIITSSDSLVRLVSVLFLILIGQAREVLLMKEAKSIQKS